MPPLRKLIHEIHRRSLWQVLGVYAVASWIIYQVVVALWEGVGLPDWVPVTALALLLVGLPIVLATAFIQEGVPVVSEPASGARAAVEGLENTADTVSGQRPSPTTSPGAAGTTSPTPGTSPTPITRPRGGTLFTWSKAITGGVLAFAALGLAAAGFMGMRALGIGPAATLISSGAMAERDVVVLARFENGTPDASLGQVVTEGLRIQLAQSPVLRLADEADIDRVLDRMQREAPNGIGPALAREIAAREGYKGVIVGTVASAGGGYLFSARLVNAADGHVMATFGATARDSTEIIDAVDRLGREIREAVGESLRTIRANEPLARVSTGSLEALRRYSGAERLAYRGDPSGALMLFEEAAQIDSTFAMAYRKIGVTAFQLGLPEDRVDAAFTRAYELRDRLPEVERGLATGTYFIYVEDDPDRAILAYRRVLDLDPDNWAALNNLAIILGGRGQNEEAAELYQRVLDTSPIPVAWTNLANRLADMGRIDSARAVLRNAAEAHPGTARMGRFQLALEATYGDPTAARDLADSLAAAHPGDALVQRQAVLYHHYLDAVRGRLREAIDHSERRQEVLEMQGRLDLAATEAARAAWLLATHELPERARAAADAVDGEVDRLAADNPFVHVWLADIYSRLGDDAATRRHLAALQALEDDPPDSAPWRREGLIARAEGRYEDALDAWSRADRIDECLDECEHRFPGELFEALAMPDSAIARYEAFLDDQDLARISTWAYDLGAVLFRLAGLHEEHGSPERAAVLYARYVDLMADADAELQPRVESARRALERLAGEGG